MYIEFYNHHSTFRKFIRKAVKLPFGASKSIKAIVNWYQALNKYNKNEDAILILFSKYPYIGIKI